MSWYLDLDNRLRRLTNGPVITICSSVLYSTNLSLKAGAASLGVDLTIGGYVSGSACVATELVDT